MDPALEMSMLYTPCNESFDELPPLFDEQAQTNNTAARMIGYNFFMSFEFC